MAVRFLIFLFWLFIAGVLPAAYISPVVTPQGNLLAPTNLFRTNIIAGTNVHIEFWSTNGKIRINASGTGGTNIFGGGETNARYVLFDYWTNTLPNAVVLTGDGKAIELVTNGVFLEVTYTGTMTGETNFGVNMLQPGGSAQGLYAGKSNQALLFRTLVLSNDISYISNENSLVLFTSPDAATVSQAASNFALAVLADLEERKQPFSTNLTNWAKLSTNTLHLIASNAVRVEAGTNISVQTNEFGYTMVYKVNVDPGAWTNSAVSLLTNGVVVTNKARVIDIYSLSNITIIGTNEGAGLVRIGLGSPNPGTGSGGGGETNANYLLYGQATNVLPNAKRLSGDGNTISLLTNAGLIIITNSATGSGETNVGANLETPSSIVQGLYAGKSGTVLLFRSLIASNGISFVSNANSLVLFANSNNAALLQAATNHALTTAGPRQWGTAVLTNLSGTGAFTNLLSAGTNILFTTNAGVVSISATGSGSGGGGETNANYLLYGQTTNVLPNARVLSGDGNSISLVTNAGFLVITNAATGTMATGTNTLFVSPTGNDATAQRGRLDRPWATLDGAISNAAAGDTIWMLPGAYTNYLMRHSWTNWGLGGALNITNRTNLTIIAHGATIYWPTQITGILIRHCDNVRISGLGIQNLARHTSPNLHELPPDYVLDWMTVMGTWGMLEVADSSRVTIEQCSLWGGWNHGILGDPGDRYTNFIGATNSIIVRQCRLEKVGSMKSFSPLGRDGTAIVPSTGWIVEGNEILDCMHGIELYPLPSAEHRIARQPAAVITGNRIRDTVSHGIWIDAAPAVVSGNSVSRDPWRTNYAWYNVGILAQVTAEAVVADNIVSGHEDGLRINKLTNSTITGNVVRDGVRGIALYDVENCVVANNMVIGMKQCGVHTLNQVVEVLLAGNVFRDCTRADGSKAAIFIASGWWSNVTVRGNQFLATNSADMEYALKASAAMAKRLRWTDNQVRTAGLGLFSGLTRSSFAGPPVASVEDEYFPALWDGEHFSNVLSIASSPELAVIIPMPPEAAPWEAEEQYIWFVITEAEANCRASYVLHGPPVTLPIVWHNGTSWNMQWENKPTTFPSNAILTLDIVALPGSNIVVRHTLSSESGGGGGAPGATYVLHGTTNVLFTNALVLRGDGNTISLRTNGNQLIITNAATGSGEANFGQNLELPSSIVQGLYAYKSGSALMFRSLIAGNGINFISNANSLVLFANSNNAPLLQAATNFALTTAGPRQWGTAVLTNLSGTGAFTNLLSAGTNILFTTNDGVVSISATGSDSGGGGASPLIDLTQASTTMCMWDEFAVFNQGTTPRFVPSGLIGQVSGSGATFNQTGSAANAPGVVRMESGSTTNGKVWISCGTGSTSLLGNMADKAVTNLWRVMFVSTNTESSQAYYEYGMGNLSGANESTRGLFFFIGHTNASLMFASASASGRKDFGTGITVVTNVWYNLLIESYHSSTVTNVRAAVIGQWTNTYGPAELTNSFFIGTPTFILPQCIVKSYAGTDSKMVSLDAVYCNVRLNSPRW